MATARAWIKKIIDTLACHTMPMNDPSRPEHEIGVLFEAYTASNRVEALLSRALADTELKPVGYAILSILASTEEATPSEVAHVSGTRPSTLSGHLSDLTKRGWIRRQRGEDGRVAVLTMTTEGRKVHTKAQQRVAEMVGHLHRELNIPTDTVRHALRELSDGLERVIAHS